MKIAFDIGGVISKYPIIIKKFIEMIDCANLWIKHSYLADYTSVYIITDQHPKDEVIKVLESN